MQQIELARRIGKTQGYISKIEGGHQGVDVLLLYDIAIALGNEPAALYTHVVAEIS
ncbi:MULTISPECIES: helix-turn-helix domain-containing protein [Sphingomonas]|uniref:helix-turn-helix domain-containing protein n=1 Tax=Sphingomonas TaxID=13687 RepID=UPI003863582F